MNVSVPSGPVAVHDMGGTKASARAHFIAGDSGECHHVVSGSAGDIGNNNVVAAVSNIYAILVLHVLT